MPNGGVLVDSSKNIASVVLISKYVCGADKVRFASHRDLPDVGRVQGHILDILYNLKRIEKLCASSGSAR